MTSINALRLDQRSGLLLCDEARYWNPEWMIFYTPEKIRRIVEPDMTRSSRSVMFMGQTGTSSIGDEWIAEITRAITSEYTSARDQGEEQARRIARLPELVRIAFRTIIQVKQAHIDDFLHGRFGFTSRDLIRGYYLDSAGEKVKITNTEQVKDALKFLTFSESSEEVKGIFGNSQILAGYHPDDGFRMYYMTERWPVCEEVQEIFTAQGSGRDTCDLNFARFADTRPLVQRRGDEPIPRNKGLFALLKGLHQALSQTAGIGGYPKIIYIDGHQPDPADWVLEISDCRSKLALEMVSAAVDGWVAPEMVETALEELIFNGADFFSINDRFIKSARDMNGLIRYLRKYSSE
ncbi:hypothetical protein JXA80_00795 [bacterium]|nr:hypothetical protein [candidate division CSSED10-310 bacterium]